MSGPTAWVTGEQLSHDNPVLAGARRVLMIESRAALRARRFHRRRLHLVLTAMRTFAQELRDAGVEVDYRRATSFADGVAEHRRDCRPDEVRVLAPTGRRARAALAGIPGVRTVEETLFLTHPEVFAAWAEGRKRMLMADFYRYQRRRLGLLMDGDRPAGGRWSYDVENREPPPTERRPPRPYRPRETATDREVRREFSDMDLAPIGADGPRELPASRDEARRALDRFLETRLGDFGRWQDAMLHGERYMWHSLLSSSLNLGLLSPGECVERAEERYRAGAAPLAAVEGFVRQIAGWREYVWGLYRTFEWSGRNALSARAPLPELFWGGPTDMRCLADAVGGVLEHGYAHHIERLMLFGNLMLLLGVHPEEALEWFHSCFVDSAEWVMVPNVYGMALHADGGLMATKPYAATGRYVDRMSDHCAGCRYRPGDRVGERACPFTLLFWDFLARKRRRFAANPRMRPLYRTLERFDADERGEIARRGRGLRRRFDA